MNHPEQEMILCNNCVIEFVATHDDLGTYFCPSCEQIKRRPEILKPLDRAFRALDLHFKVLSLMKHPNINL